MADSTTTLTVNAYPNGSDRTQRRVKYTGLCAIAASPKTYPANGVPLTWFPMAKAEGGVMSPDSSSKPIDVRFASISGSVYDYKWDKAHGTIRVYTGGTEATTDAAIPAGVSGDSIQFEAQFIKDI